MNCLCQAKKGKQTSKSGKGGKRSSNIGGAFLGDSVPLPREVYNLHVDLVNIYGTDPFNFKTNNLKNDIIFLMNEEHNKHVEELKEIMNGRQKVIDNLIKELQSIKATL